jgi:hypothetical protein
MVVLLPNKLEALSSNPSTAKKRRTRVIEESALRIVALKLGASFRRAWRWRGSPGIFFHSPIPIRTELCVPGCVTTADRQCLLELLFFFFPYGAGD